MKAYVDINADRSEKVRYDKAEYPAYIRKGVLSNYLNYAAESHWHDDVEFILILSGHMLYNVNGEIVDLREGEGIFVNARQLHFGFSDDRSECIFICILLHPVLLCSSKTIEQKYVSPVLFNEHLAFCHLTRNSGWETQILSDIQLLYDSRDAKTAELNIQKLFFDIWIQLYENSPSIQQDDLPCHHHLSALKDMMAFISEHYQTKLSLADIAKAGNMSKTSCCSVFKRYINKTPNEYLTELRLRKGVELMHTTDMTITEISFESGFSGTSYFSETFRKYYDCSPSEYRKLHQQHTNQGADS